VNAITANTRKARNTGSDERRRWVRLPLALPVFLRGIDNAGREFLEFSTALNVSAGGMLLAARSSLPSDANLSLEIPSAPQPAATPPHAVRIFKAELVRDLISGGCHLMGVRFSHPLL
jgi:hypothetical protein